MAFIGPRDEMGDLLNVPDAEKNVKNFHLYGSWYGDRIITYGITGSSYSQQGNNPFTTAANEFNNITNQALSMGYDLLVHFQILTKK